MTRPVNKEKLLNQMLELVAKDVKKIKKESARKLSRGSATDLCNYIKVLKEIEEAKSQIEDNKRKKLSTLSIEDLEKQLKDLEKK